LQLFVNDFQSFLGFRIHSNFPNDELRLALKLSLLESKLPRVENGEQSAATSRDAEGM
jgi:hypothetical protein